LTSSIEGKRPSYNEDEQCLFETIKARSLTEVRVVYLHGEAFTIEVQLTDTVRRTKERIAALEAIRLDKQEIFANDRHLKNARTLEPSGVVVYVKTPSGTFESVGCQAFDLVSAIKERLEQ
jgi:hypothetical protein